jgi:sugar lactone lactonase YvrE
VAFHAVDPKFVATINTDGTITRFDFPGGSTPDYTQPPTQTLIASGGFRGDISQVGPDTCLYVPQEGARYADGTISDPLNDEGQRDNSIVRICPGFAPPTGTTLTTVAGNGEQGFNGDTDPTTGHPTALEAQLDFPIGVTSDAAGHVYFVDQHNHRVRRVDAATGFISTVAGNGVAGFNGDGIQATGAQLNVPNGLALDSAGNLFIADLGNQRVRRVCLNAGGCGPVVGSPSIAFGVITTVAGTGNYGPAVNVGAATAANLFNPAGVAIHAGNLYIADSLNQQVRRVSSAGTISLFAGRPEGNAGFNGDGVATAATLNSPLAVAVHASSGNVYIADEGNNRIRKVSGGMMTTVAGNGVAGFSGDCVAGGALSAQLNAPSGVAVDASEIVYIGDLGNNRIRRLDGATINSLAVGGELNSPYGVATNTTGDVLVADLLSQRVRRIGSPTGCFIEP